MKLNNFRYALALALMLYDVEFTDEEDAIEIALVAHNFIGNKNTHLIRTQLDVDCKTGEVELPCDADLIEAITYCGPEDHKYTSNTKQFGETSYVEDYIEHKKAFLDPEYLSGKFVKYRKEGNKIIVNKGFGKINLLYHGVVLDEDGLPEINDKEAVAIADYLAYVYKYKEAIRTNNQAIMRLAQELKQQWLFHCDAARVPEYISQNEVNEILDVISSANRKVHNKSYKPNI